MRENYDKTIFVLALPVMLEQLMDTLTQYVDTAMVGALGTVATAAVGSTTTVSWLIGSTISGLGVGLLAIIARSIGAGNREQASRAAGQAVSLVLITGLLFTALTMALADLVPVWMRADESIRPDASAYFRIVYSTLLFRTARIIFGTVLRASGDTKTPMRVGIGVNVINVVLNFLLIYDTRTLTLGGYAVRVWGAGLGVRGAAWATAAAVALGGIVLTLRLWFHREISPRGCSILPDREIMLPCLRVAVPNVLQRFCTSLGYVVFAAMINDLGAISTAAHTVANTVESAFYVPGYGMMAAAGTLTGNCLGAGDEQRFRQLSHRLVVLELLMMGVSGGLLFAFAPQLVQLFSKDEAVIRLGAAVLRMVALSEPFYGVSIVTEGMLQGAGKTKMPFLLSTGSMWLVRIVGTFICVELLGMGLESAWGCMIANNLCLMACFQIYFRHLMKTNRLGF